MFTLFTNNKRNTLSVLIYKQKETNDWTKLDQIVNNLFNSQTCIVIGLFTGAGV